jgi:hypothetical protein
MSMETPSAMRRDDDVQAVDSLVTNRAPEIELDFISSKKSQYPGRGTPDDPFIIDWDPADVQNPYNWSKLRKWVITAQVYFALLYASKHCLLMGV